MNDSLGQSRTVSSNRDILLFERLVAGDLQGLYREDAERMAEMARQTVESLREGPAGQPPADDGVRAKWRLPGGQEIEIGTNLRREAFAARLEDALPSVATFRTAKVKDLAVDLIAGTEIPCNSVQDAENAFDEAIERFVEGLPASLAKAENVIAARRLSPEAADALRDLVCSSEKFNSEVFDAEAVSDLADPVRRAFDSLLAVLREPGLSAADGFAAIGTFFDSALVVFRDKMPKIEESIDKTNALEAFFLIAFDGKLDAAAPLRDFLARADVAPKLAIRPPAAMLYGVFESMKESVDPKAANDALLGALGTPRLPIRHAAALVRAREQLAAEKKEAVDTYVRGRSQAAERLRGAFENRLGPEPASPVSTLSSTYQAVVNTMLNRSIVRDMQKFELGRETQFDLDLKRGFKIVLAGVGEVSRDPAAARGQFAKFVTRNPAATYAKLDLRTRRKAHLAMAIASQGSHNAVVFGFGVLLDPQGRSTDVSFAGRQGDRTFTMEIDANGGLAVRFRGKQQPSHLIVGDQSFHCGPGSQVETKFDLLVSREEQERLAGVNFAAYDDGPVSQVIDRGQRVDKFKQAKFAFPRNYSIRMDVGPSLVADLR